MSQESLLSIGEVSVASPLDARTRGQGCSQRLVVQYNAALLRGVATLPYLFFESRGKTAKFSRRRFLKV